MAQEIIQGKVQKVVWAKEEDRFYIFRISTGKGLYSAKGTVPSGSLVEGLSVTLKGEWNDHPKYGKSFHFTRFGLSKTTTVEGIVRVLQSGIEGIGPVTARKLVDTYGADTVTVLNDTPERLITDLPELFGSEAGQRKWSRIVDKWTDFKASGGILAWLMSHGLGPKTAKKVYDHFGSETIKVVKENPYYLLDVPSVGFKIADRVAFRLDTPPDSPWRIQAAIYHVLHRVGGQDGHLYMSRDDLYEAILKITKLGVASFGRKLLDSEVHDTCVEMSQEDFKPAFCRLVIEGNQIYTRQRFDFEDRSARKLAELMNTPVSSAHISTAQLEKFIREYESLEGISLSERQQDGLREAINSKVLLLTGLPGTGKTTLLKAIMRLYEMMAIDVMLLAPTGIAAKRMHQVTKRPASTIHRCLMFTGDHWRRNEYEPLVIDAVIVDESSMVDQEVLYRLLVALTSKTRLVLVGDPAQLPSVGPGNVLHQLIESGEIPHVHLTEIFRQAEASDIVTNAHRITNGQLPVFVDGKGRDFHFLETKSDEKTIDMVLRAAAKFHSKKVGFHVISPMHKGDLGVSNLNELLKAELNPPADTKVEAKVGSYKEFREGDRIMVTSNDYDLGIFNGDMSVIQSIDIKGQKISFYVEQISDEGQSFQKLVTLSFDMANDMLRLAFCTTVHKMQGLEADVILMPFTSAFTVMLQRNLLYTAVTRAKKKVFIFGEWKALRRAVNTTRVQTRNTRLAERLRDEMAYIDA